MMIQLTHSAESSRETAAWFIPGGESQAWLEEIALWEAPAETLRLYVIATPERETDLLLGVLVVGCPQPARRHRAIPWACVVGRLFVPVESAFDPPVTDQELQQLLPGEDSVCVWYPQSGLIRFDSDESLRVSDLLSCGSLRGSQWDRAEQGVAFAKRLVSVTAEELPSVDDVIGSSRDDIGEEGDRLDDLPPAPDESSQGPIAQAGRSVAEFVARAVQRLTSSESGRSGAAAGTGASGWMENIGTWAQGVLNRARLDSERARELRRLLSMLDSDPDRGLRKALSFGNSGSHRGTAPPGSRLSSRDVDFSLGWLTSGGPADYWDVPFEIQQQLFAKYRELANRELQLGRSRRAAYIFAELIGDLQAAAQALEQGGFYLEAAALYQDRLNQPKQAAQCLERGGLLHQAAELYQEQNEYEDAARVYDQLGQTDDARRHWTLVIQKLCGSGNELRAAELARDKLDNHELALELLDAAWQQNVRSGPQCLTEWFRLNGELGRHSVADERLTELRQQPARAELILSVLAETHQSYPDRTLRHQCADVSRVLVANRLPDAALAEQEQLIRGLARFDRHDKLLKRDCDRSLVRHKRAMAEAPVGRIRKPGSIEIVFEEQLKKSINWLTAASTPRALYLAAHDPERSGLELHQIAWTNDGLGDARWHVSWDGRTDFSAWNRPLLLPDPTLKQPVVVYLNQLRQLPFRSVPYPEPGLEAMSLSRLDPAQTLTAATDRTGTIWNLATNGSGFWIETVDRKTQSVQSMADLTDVFNTSLVDLNAEPTDVSFEFRLLVAHRRWFIARGSSVYVSDEQLRLHRTVRFEAPVIDIAVSADHTRRRLVVSTTDGTFVICDNFEHGSPKRLSVDLSSARVTLTKGGLIAAADGRRCVMVQTSSGQLRECEWPDKGQPVAIVPTTRPHGFAALSLLGVVYGFEWT